MCHSMTIKLIHIPIFHLEISVLQYINFRLHSIGKVSGNYPTTVHPQKLQPLFHQPPNKTDYVDAAKENETKKSSANERLDKEHVLQRNIRLVSPDNSQSTSNLHQKILFSLHHQQSSEHHHHRTESSFLWSANKTLLHAIRLQVINGKKIKKLCSIYKI